MERARRASPFPLGQAFFGLSQEYRKQFWIQIHDLVYHGNGGFIFSEVYNMPIWLRKFNILQINKYNKKQEEEFKKKHKMSDEKFEMFKKAAAAKPMTLDDAYYLINRDMQARNIANNTKKDMLGQMQNVRNIPTSSSDSNNQGNSQKSPDNQLFDNMLGLDEDVDNLFG